MLKKNSSILRLLSLFLSLLFLSYCNAIENLQIEVIPTPSENILLKSPTPLITNVPTQLPTDLVPINTVTQEPKDYLFIETPIPGISDRLCDAVPEPSVLISDRENDNKIYSKGRFTLCYLDKLMAFDLDKGIIGNKEDPGMDIYLVVGKTTGDKNIYYHLNGGKNAYIQHLEIEYPTYEDCEKILPTTNFPTRHGAIFVCEDPSGCILTNEKRIGFVHIERKDPVGFESVEVSFVLWNVEK